MKKLILPAAICACTIICNGATTDNIIDLGWKYSADSARWQSVDLPHDWSINGPFDPNAACRNDGGYLPTGKGYYRKAINLADYDKDKVYKLYFEGVYMDSKVKVNGIDVGGHPYGYSSFWCDITPAVKAGENIIEVTVDNSKQRNCRWYTGSGIYRHVHLTESGKLHFDPWSIFVRTSDISADSAQVRVDLDFINRLDEAEETVIKVDILDPDGKTAASTHYFSYLPAQSSTSNFTILTVPQPRLWSPDTPHMYKARLTAKSLTGETIDTAEQDFGIRSIEYSTDGFKLNGVPVVINGACVHHDNGILGAASFDAAEWRKAKLMKDAGFNAIRCSHNAPAPAMLDACDRLGLMVIDEAFDGWRDSKTEHDYSELIDSCWQQDIAAMVLRDRNHPSIIAWSIGNEIIERKKPEAVTTAHDLASLCRRLDPTRPVTSALAAWDDDWEIYDPLAAQLDIVGYNYLIHKADDDHARVPQRVMWQTESFPRDAYGNWLTATTKPYVLGDFVWTGLDYLGEAGIGRHYYAGEVEGEHWERPIWPWHGALCGDVDITGLRRPISHYRDMLYNRNEGIYMAVREPDGYRGTIKETLWGTYPTVESWTWPGWEGKPIEVEVISTAPAVRLYLDDTLIAEQPTDASNGWRTVFTLPYQSGTLKAQGVGTDYETQIVTAGTPARIELTADRDSYNADGSDIAYITVLLTDADGVQVPDDDREITFDVTGNGRLVATGSGDMKDCTSYTAARRKTHNGRALLAVRTTTDPGEICITATAGDITQKATVISK